MATSSNNNITRELKRNIGEDVDVNVEVHIYDLSGNRLYSFHETPKQYWTINDTTLPTMEDIEIDGVTQEDLS